MDQKTIYIISKGILFINMKKKYKFNLKPFDFHKKSYYHRKVIEY